MSLVDESNHIVNDLSDQNKLDVSGVVNDHNLNGYNALYKCTRNIKKFNGLSIGHLNVRSLLPKMEEIRFIVATADFDIFCINESWLDPSIYEHEFKIDGYSAISRPRNRHGGGVMIYVKECLKFNRRLDLEIHDIESIWVEINFEKTQMLVCSMYRPPSSDRDYYEKMSDSIESACLEDKIVVIIGDLNFNYIFDENLHRNPLYHIECSNGLKQLVNNYTRETATSKSVIDVIFTSHHNLHKCTDVIKLSLSDHYLVYTIVGHSKLNVKDQIHKEVKYRCYKNFEESKFLQDVADSDILCNVSEINDINFAWSTWKNEFLRICDAHAPICVSRMKNRYKPWVTSDIVQLMHRRDFVYKKSLKNPSIDLVNEYKSLRNEVGVQIELSKKRYYDDLYNVGKSNSKSLWKELKKLSGGIPCENTTTKLSAKEFNYFFSSIGSNTTKHLNDNINLLWKGPESIYHFTFNDIHVSDTTKLLKQLSSSSSLDVLNFDCKLLKLSCSLIAGQLTHMFNLSFKFGNVPNDWKYARITPIYKGKGCTDEPVNYRPISVLSFIAKIIEKLVQCQFMYFLVNHQFITLDQYAYRKFHSTTNCLHTTIDEWLENMNDKLLTGVCFLDIAKCFDTINHDLLLQKLSKYGVKGNEMLWFTSYLCNRSQSVYYKNKLAESVNVNIGVPQGSTLGPLLFMVFVNDLPLHVNGARCTMYADDTIIYVNDENVVGINSKMNEIMSNVSHWYTANRLVLNVSKSNAMLIGRSIDENQRNQFTVNINDACVENVRCTKYLGVHIDEQLKFDIHVNNLVKRLSAKISWLSRLRKVVPKDLLILTFKSYIQPIFDYACTVWGCSNININQIQRLQNRAARVICSNFDIINTRGLDLVHELQWQSVSQRIDYFICTQMYNSIYGNAPDYLVNSINMACDINNVNTRSSDTMNVQVPFCQTDQFKKSLSYRGAVLWNQLSNEIQELSTLDEFKHHVRSFVKTR